MTAARLCAAFQATRTPAVASCFRGHDGSAPVSGAVTRAVCRAGFAIYRLSGDRSETELGLTFGAGAARQT